MPKVTIEHFLYILIVLLSIISLALIAASPAFLRGTHVVYQAF